MAKITIASTRGRVRSPKEMWPIRLHQGYGVAGTAASNTRLVTQRAMMFSTMRSVNAEIVKNGLTSSAERMIDPSAT